MIDFNKIKLFKEASETIRMELQRMSESDLSIDNMLYLTIIVAELELTDRVAREFGLAVKEKLEPQIEAVIKEERDKTSAIPQPNKTINS